MGSVLLVVLALLQDPRSEPSREEILRQVDARRVDRAVRKGADWLLASWERGRLKAFRHNGREGRPEDLLLLTLLHAGIPRNDPRVSRLLTQNWSVKEIAGGDTPKIAGVYYYLYSLERAGTLFGTEVMGRYVWYPEGARFLLENQGPDGSWGTRTSHTCFAILFLRRATDDFRAPVAMVDAEKR